jgi:hypothetical protein
LAPVLMNCRLSTMGSCVLCLEFGRNQASLDLRNSDRLSDAPRSRRGKASRRLRGLEGALHVLMPRVRAIAQGKMVVGEL